MIPRRNLQFVRIYLGLTQDELAEKGGFSRSTVSHVENGRKEPSFKIAVKLAGVLGVPFEEELFELTEEVNPEYTKRIIDFLLKSKGGKDEKTVSSKDSTS